MFVTPQSGKDDEIDDHDRAEHVADLRRAARLNQEQCDQNRRSRSAPPAAGSGAWTTSSPSTAERTEMAGVIIASP